MFELLTSGIGTTLQAVPLKCSEKVSFWWVAESRNVPTIHTSSGPFAEIALRVVLGCATCVFLSWVGRAGLSEGPRSPAEEALDDEADRQSRPEQLPGDHDVAVRLDGDRRSLAGQAGRHAAGAEGGVQGTSAV